MPWADAKTLHYKCLNYFTEVGEKKVCVGISHFIISSPMLLLIHCSLVFLGFKLLFLFMTILVGLRESENK